MIDKVKKRAILDGRPSAPSIPPRTKRAREILRCMLPPRQSSGSITVQMAWPMGCAAGSALRSSQGMRGRSLDCRSRGSTSYGWMLSEAACLIRLRRRKCLSIGRRRIPSGQPVLARTSEGSIPAGASGKRPKAQDTPCMETSMNRARPLLLAASAKIGVSDKSVRLESPLGPKGKPTGLSTRPV